MIRSSWREILLLQIFSLQYFCQFLLTKLHILTYSFTYFNSKTTYLHIFNFLLTVPSNSLFSLKILLTTLGFHKSLSFSFSSPPFTPPTTSRAHVYIFPSPPIPCILIFTYLYLVYSPNHNMQRKTPISFYTD